MEKHLSVFSPGSKGPGTRALHKSPLCPFPFSHIIFKHIVQLQTQYSLVLLCPNKAGALCPPVLWVIHQHGVFYMWLIQEYVFPSCRRMESYLPCLFSTLGSVVTLEILNWWKVVLDIYLVAMRVPWWWTRNLISLSLSLYMCELKRLIVMFIIWFVVLVHGHPVFGAVWGTLVTFSKLHFCPHDYRVVIIKLWKASKRGTCHVWLFSECLTFTSFHLFTEWVSEWMNALEFCSLTHFLLGDWRKL